MWCSLPSQMFRFESSMRLCSAMRLGVGRKQADHRPSIQACMYPHAQRRIRTFEYLHTCMYTCSVHACMHACMTMHADRNMYIHTISLCVGTYGWTEPEKGADITKRYGQTHTDKLEHSLLASGSTAQFRPQCNATSPACVAAAKLSSSAVENIS